MKTYKTISNATRRKGLAVLGAILLPGLAHGVDYGSLRTIPASAMAQGEQIVLSWPANADIESYLVTRRDSAGAIKRFDGGATGMVDADVERGEVYEYSITGTNTAVGQSAMGVIATGIEAPLMDDRGRMILVVDDTVAPALEAELERLRRDLIGDGWEVARTDVSPQAGAPEVKAAIAAAQAQEPDRTRSVFLIGKIAVPYSGSIYPDGHPDHRGAWPADGYYGDLDGNWTDSSADVTASRPENTNVPGDGKFDQSSFPSEVELEVGRLDLSRLPAFAGSDEIALLRRYLDKSHAFRQAMWTLERRALVDDHFSHLSEGIARGSRGSFASFFGAGAVQDGDWKTELPGNGYLCAYGSGAGNYGSISGVANTADFAAGNFKVAFAFFCGSYFGDWDNENNVMRAALASGDYTLAAAWTGRPQWKTHGMGMGETIGSAARATQNNKNDAYFYSATNRNRVHINLLGDPSLRLHPVAPPQSASAAPAAAGVRIGWSPSAEPVLGYHLYRAAAWDARFVRLTAEPVDAPAFTDADAPAAGCVYMVRAVKLEQGSGSYFNASQGAFAEFGGGEFLPEPSVVSVAVGEPQTTEGAEATASIVIKREGGDLSQPLTVALDLSGSATSAQDFEPVAGQITIPAGATEATVAIKANADSEVEGEESVTVTALQGDGFTLASASASILIEDATAVTEPPVAGVSIDDWKWTHFGAYAAHPLYGADGGDPDHDGLSNLYEYAMGSDPMRKTGEAPLRGVRAEAGNLVAFYTRNPAAVDARIVIEASADLRAWQDAEGAAGQEVVGEEGGNELIKVSLPLDGAHRFLRLGVSRVAAATSTEA